MSSQEWNDGGCGFLSVEEIRLLVTGDLDLHRSTAWNRHIDGECVECRLLAADMETCAELEEKGAGSREQEEFGRREELLRKRLVLEAKQARVPGDLQPRPAIPIWARTAVAAIVLSAVALFTFLNRDIHHPGETLTLPDGSTVTIEAMPFQAPPTLRGTVSRKDLWELAGRAYTRKNYRKVEQLLTQVSGGPNEADALLYRGIALYMLGDSGPCTEVLKQARVIAEENDLPTGAILYYRGLALLAEEEPEQARVVLEEAHRAGGRFAKQAREVAGWLAP